MEADTTINLTTPRSWYGDQRLGTFVISVDDKKVGTLMPRGSLQVRVAPGRHRVRARQWYYYSSPALEVEPAAGETVQLTVDVVRRDSLLMRFLTLMFMPWRGIAIRQVGS